MNKRALAVGLLVACAIHLWIIWPAAREVPAPAPTEVPMPPLDSVAVRELPSDKEPEPKQTEDSSRQQDAKAQQPAQQLAESKPADAHPEPAPKPEPAVAKAEPVTPAEPAAVQLAQATPAEPPAVPTPVPAPAPAPEAASLTQAPAPTQALAQQTPVIESTPTVPDSGPAQLFDPIAAQEVVIESAPVQDAPLPPVDARTLPPAPSTVGALREPEPPPLPPLPPSPASRVEAPLPSPALASPEASAPAHQPAPDAAPRRASPALRMRSRELRSWNRDDVLSSLPKPDPAFLTATDPRAGRTQSPPSDPQAIVPPTVSERGAELTSAPAAAATPVPTERIELAPRTPAAYAPVRYSASLDRGSGRSKGTSASGGGAQATDRGYLKSLGPVQQDPVARIAWGDASAAMRTMSLGRMALVIVNDDLKVVASIDSSTGTWARAGLPAQMATFSNRVRVVDHVGAFAAFSRFCQPHEHLAVLVPIGLERRIESAMDQAARAQGLSRCHVAACYGRLEPRQGALEFVIDRVERREIQ